MRIEKISENQIRCTLNKKDLMDRQLKLSELAYGTEKAKALFRDMMQQAAYQFGFETDDIPLMIEAIPVSSESLVLVITKVEDPDELDTRFSKFSPDDGEDDYTESEYGDTAYADEILHCFDELNELMGEDDLPDTPEDGVDTTNVLAGKNGSATETIDDGGEAKPVCVKTDFSKIFSFLSLEAICKMAAHIMYAYRGKNSIYKDPVHGIYYLVISKSSHTPEEFNKICNIISEYGRAENTTYASCAFFTEHFDLIIKDRGIQTLGRL